MRRLLFILLVFLNITLIPNISLSQEYQSAKERNKNKPTLFDSYSDTSNVHPNFFNDISLVKLDEKVTLQVTQQMVFKGKVHILHETLDYRTVSIESEEIPGLRIILTHTSEDKYFGIIGCVKHKDVMVLKFNDQENKYFWIKKEMSDIVPD